DREVAPLISKELDGLASRLRSEAGAPAGPLLEATRTRLSAAGFKVQYLELRALPELGSQEHAPTTDRAALLAVAAYLGSTRLIDNRILHPHALESLGHVFHQKP